jgi:hypothetical protein
LRDSRNDSQSELQEETYIKTVQLDTYHSRGSVERTKGMDPAHTLRHPDVILHMNCDVWEGNVVAGR